MGEPSADTTCRTLPVRLDCCASLMLGLRPAAFSSSDTALPEAKELGQFVAISSAGAGHVQALRFPGGAFLRAHLGTAYHQVSIGNQGGPNGPCRRLRRKSPAGLHQPQAG